MQRLTSLLEVGLCKVEPCKVGPCKVGPRSSDPIIPRPDSLVFLDIARGEKEGDALLCIPGFLILAVPAMVVFAEDDHFRQRNGEKGEEKGVGGRSVSLGWTFGNEGCVCYVLNQWW